MCGNMSGNWTKKRRAAFKTELLYLWCYVNFWFENFFDLKVILHDAKKENFSKYRDEDLCYLPREVYKM